MHQHLCHKKLSQGWQRGQACRTFLTSSLIAMQNMLLCVAVGACRSQNFVGCWSPRSVGMVPDPVETCPSTHLVPWLSNSQEIFFIQNITIQLLKMRKISYTTLGLSCRFKKSPVNDDRVASTLHTGRYLLLEHLQLLLLFHTAHSAEHLDAMLYQLT